MYVLSYSHGNGDIGVLAVGKDASKLIARAVLDLDLLLDERGEVRQGHLMKEHFGGKDWALMYNGDEDESLSYTIEPVEVVE